jgi:hypothetical protein
MSRHRPYPYTLSYSKRHTSGVLAGMLHHTSIGVVSVQAARDHVAGWVKYADRNGYTVEDCVVTDIETMQTTRIMTA